MIATHNGHLVPGLDGSLSGENERLKSFSLLIDWKEILRLAFIFRDLSRLPANALSKSM